MGLPRQPGGCFTILRILGILERIGSSQATFAKFIKVASKWQQRSQLPHIGPGNVRIRWVPGHTGLFTRPINANCTNCTNSRTTPPPKPSPSPTNPTLHPRDYSRSCFNHRRRDTEHLEEWPSRLLTTNPSRDPVEMRSVFLRYTIQKLQPRLLAVQQLHE
jgi:hypothetical protein